MALLVHVRGISTSSSSHVGDLLTQLGILDNIRVSESSCVEAVYGCNPRFVISFFGTTYVPAVTASNLNIVCLVLTTVIYSIVASFPRHAMNNSCMYRQPLLEYSVSVLSSSNASPVKCSPMQD